MVCQHAKVPCPGWGQTCDPHQLKVHSPKLPLIQAFDWTAHSCSSSTSTVALFLITKPWLEEMDMSVMIWVCSEPRLENHTRDEGLMQNSETPATIISTSSWLYIWAFHGMSSCGTDKYKLQMGVLICTECSSGPLPYSSQSQVREWAELLNYLWSETSKQFQKQLQEDAVSRQLQHWQPLDQETKAVSRELLPNGRNGRRSHGLVCLCLLWTQSFVFGMAFMRSSWHMSNNTSRESLVLEKWNNPAFSGRRPSHASWVPAAKGITYSAPVTTACLSSPDAAQFRNLLAFLIQPPPRSQRSNGMLLIFRTFDDIIVIHRVWNTLIAGSGSWNRAEKPLKHLKWEGDSVKL